ncbi:MAG: N-acetylglucosamine malate deacetylase 2 [Rhodospirillaceae bacterium]|jgi:LmbE family N-acetylglucosaminyl deacetylase|nr:N-acetylglucosamine malate deacetylase 2 [Rhodospirillaceae bacterium]
MITVPNTPRARAAGFLAALRTAEGPIPAERVAVIVAHPDDETIGIGGQLPRMQGVTIVHVTTGAPANMMDGRAHGFLTSSAYAARRRAELRAAMACASVPENALYCLGLTDQEAFLYLPEIARRLAAFLAGRTIEVVITHPYEGGHPDHDATAFGVHAASALLSGSGRSAPGLVEMAFYHAGPAGLQTQCFLPAPDYPELALELDEHAWQCKQRMIAAHETQRRTLAQFTSRIERFRTAGEYDFAALPNDGLLYYEKFDWGATGPLWQVKAVTALAELGLT